jgi:hypothetical protein
MSESPHPIIQARRAQMFPTLAPADIDRLRRFGETRSYGSGECIIRAGDVAPGLIVVLSKLVMVRACASPLLEAERCAGRGVRFFSLQPTKRLRSPFGARRRKGTIEE